jgi:hypothetical protein
MVYDAQNYWDSGVCLSSGILNGRKLNLFTSSGEMRELSIL